jgi:2-succinyl-5-enolpyruvyl-6-hydroxy-3-cyclohexene-1-carboxylate synthase
VNPATAEASVIVDELVRCGLTDAVLAPGSRSAPLAYALHGQSRIRLHVRMDERSAGFLAVGLAKRSGRPVVVVCTSGSAVANLHPAVIEAHESGVPLLLLTADRPPELRDTGANQTIDQVKIFGAAARWSCELGVPEERPGMVGYWRSTAARAWHRAQDPDAGPVHLNLAFREPLVPDGDTGWCEPLGPGAGPWAKVRPATAGSVLHVPPTRRGVLVVGDGAPNVKRYVAAASMAGWPVLAEPSGNARYGDHAMSAYHFLLGVPEFADAHVPEVVVTLGKPGLSRPLLSFLGRAEEHVVVTPSLARWPDPVRSATQVAEDVEIPVVSGDDAWLKSWRVADLAARDAVDAVLAERGDEVTEPRLARDLVEAMPGGSLLFVGSSMPIRDLDQVMRPRRGIRVMANRGASGIDGLVSTAVGAAVAHGNRAFALLGDLAFLHDQNGLVIGPQDYRPDLAIVVVNNDGGGIFSLLPQATAPGAAPAFERVFGTPHQVDISCVAAAHGIPYARLESMSDLGRAVAKEGLRIVEAGTSRADNAELHAQMREAAYAAVRARA